MDLYFSFSEEINRENMQLRKNCMLLRCLCKELIERFDNSETCNIKHINAVDEKALLDIKTDLIKSYKDRLKECKYPL